MTKTKNILLKLFVLLTCAVGWSSGAWAQAVSQLPSLTSGVYEMLNISNESGTGTGRGYLVNYTNASSGIGLADCTYSQYRGSHPTAKNSANTCSYWYLHKNDNGSYTIVSLSTLGGNEQPRFIQVGDPSSLTTTDTELVFADATNANHVRDGKKGVVIANKTATNQYMSAACGTNSNSNCIKRTTTIGDGGNPWLFIPVAESSLSEGQKAIRAKYLERFAHLADGVTINFQDKEGNAITGETVVYTPTSGPAVNLTSSTGTYNFGDVLYSPGLFSSADFTKILGVAYNESGKTLTFTFSQNKWYYIKVNNGGYMSSAYTNGSGDMMINNANTPTDYKGLWMEIPVTDVDAYGNATIYFINAYYGDTKVLAIIGGLNDGNASAKMYNLDEVPSGAAQLFVRRYKDSNPGAFYFKDSKTDNNYLNNRNGRLAYWDNASAYGNTGSTFNHTEVTNLPNNATIRFVAASSAVTIPGDFKVIYNAPEYYRMVGGASHLFPAVADTELTDNQNYDFGNVPYLSSAYRTNKADLRIVNVAIDGTTVTFTIDKLPRIIHRQHATFDHLATVGAAQKPNSKFIQEGQGLIDHPYAADFTDAAGYTENDRKMQNTSVFYITQYAQKGGTTTVSLPHTRQGGLGKLSKYQRWYDYTTERALSEDIVSGLSGYTMYYNGHARTNNSQGSVSIKLPSDKDEIFVGVDDSEFSDYSTDANGNLIEPSLSMRTVIRVVSAEKMAAALVAKGGADKWWEEKTYIVPNIKRGSATHKNNSDLLPLDMPFSNYWIYGNSNNLMRIVEEGGNYNQLSNNIKIDVEGDAAEHITVGIFKSKAETGLDDPLSVRYNHFLYYKINGDGLTREVPAGSQAIIKVYAKNGNSTTHYQLAKFTLNFQADSEPLAITSVIGNAKSTRSREYFKEQKMEEVASLTFSEKRVDFKSISGVGGSNLYAFPVDPTRTSYAYSPDDAFGGYRITKQGYGMKTLPVSVYERNINGGGTSLNIDDNDYYLYIDAAESPGQVASIPLDGTLCPGTRLFFYGWLTSQNPFEHGSSTAASVILELVGKKDGKDVVLATYLPGIVSDAAYTPDGEVIRSVKDGSTASNLPAFSYSYNLNGHGDDQTRIAVWQSIGFNYLVQDTGYEGYELRVINNCFSTAGGDYSLDDFRVFASSPKGNVDFTTPLCTDKVRHAKIHADYDMLKNLSEIGINELVNPNWQIKASYCFVDSIMFDDYVDAGIGVPTRELFEKDDNGNHSLKHALPYTETQIETAINNAFNVALVGRRCTKNKKDSEGVPYVDHGFHSYYIDKEYENIPVYSYRDSRPEVIYREIGTDGVRRIVFKEDVVRGEMELLKDADDNDRQYYPYMRPSRTYYLVFAPSWVDEDVLKNTNIATDVFAIETPCAYFGSFTTKDPMHVILDNADIEADLPIQAVCHGETTAFYFNIPALKADKPVVDEEYCISDEDLNNKVVPESQGVHHYRYEVSFKDDAISGVIKNLPYDWWMGGKLEERTYRGTIEEYQEATHPSIVYNHDTADPSHTHTHDADYKKHGEPVNIALAMEDFRFFYPDFGKDKFDPATGRNNISDAEWGTLLVHDYDNDSGYSLLQSEINTIKSFVNAGIIVLHRNTYDMPLTYEEAEELQDKEMSNMMEKEMNDQILELALTLNSDPSVAALLPLKGLEGTVLDKLSIDGKKRLTFEEFGNFTRDQLVGIASDLKGKKGLLTGVTPEQINTMSDGELRRVVEAELRDMPDDEMLAFAKDYFPNIGHEKRAYLVVRALNILSRETVAKLPAADQQNTTIVRAKLREQMISIFKEQKEEVLRKMWSDTSAKLTEEERAALLKDKDPATMNAEGLAVLIEDGLAKLTDDVINDLKGDRYVHFTLVPIMPSQVNFVDEPYIFCPEPRGVKLRITSHEPKMIDGFADMDYPQDMENVPVRIGLPQIKETRASAEKTLRIPVRGLKPATKNGVKAVKLAENTGYGKNIFLAETDDPKYQQTKTQGMAEAKKDMGAYTQLVGTVESMIANYPTAENRTPDNFIVVKFNEGMKFREGYTYRVGINYMENDINDDPTISCFGTMLFDMKIVPEYQKWTAAVGNSDWTNDENWARADREELNAGKQAAGDKIDALATALDDAVSYISNEDNETSTSFVPMYFTNVLLDNNATMAAVLYTEKESQEAKAFKPASRSEKTFLEGLHSTATENIIYEMEVAPSTGAWHDDENYECGLFGTYVANGITFKPAAQLGNAHFLAYNKAWVEYELDADRWYTLGSPLKASVAGDWYSPTEGGKQMTPHFYDINYDPAKNDRFRPAYYQRSWDRGGNNVVYEKSGDTYDSYVKADWSFVYNDAAVDYSAGGFSVKPDIEFMEEGDRPDDGKVLVRLPKADKAYKYYDIDGNIGDADDAVIVDDEQATRADRGSNRLLSDDLLADGTGSIAMSVSNQTADNNYLLLSNPFMAAMDMDEFFNANEDLEEKYWIMVAGEQNVSVKTDDGWITTGDAGGKYVAPLQGFFVKTKDGAANKNSIRASYTAAMQTVVTSSPTNDNGAPVLQARTRGGNAEASNIIRLTAERNGATSTAMIVLSGNAKDEFVATEDCETFIDGNIYDKPTVYTSSGSVAQTINVRKSLDMVPVGMVSSDDSETTLRFDLSAAQIGGSKLFLYDGETDSYTEIEDGAEVAMSGNTAGRYFLTTSIEDVNDALRNDTVKKGVWTISGVFCGESVEGLMPGVYVVDGVKMYVR